MDDGCHFFMGHSSSGAWVLFGKNTGRKEHLQ